MFVICPRTQTNRDILPTTSKKGYYSDNLVKNKCSQPPHLWKTFKLPFDLWSLSRQSDHLSSFPGSRTGAVVRTCVELTVVLPLFFLFFFFLHRKCRGIYAELHCFCVATHFQPIYSSTAKNYKLVKWNTYLKLNSFRNIDMLKQYF